MSRLVDLFVEWTRRRQRWPLLLILLVPAYFVFFQNFYGLEFRQVFDNWPFLWLSGLTTAVSVVGYVLLSNYERILYSNTLDRIRPRRRVVVAEPIAWQRLTYDDGTGETINVTIIKEVALMLDEFGIHLGIHPVVVPQAADQQVPVGPRDEFAIHGVVSPIGILLRSMVLSRNFSKGRALEIAKRFVQSDDITRPAGGPSVPWHRIFNLGSVFKDMINFEFQIASSVATGIRTALTRVFLRNALMTMLYRDEHGAGKSVAESIVDMGMLLSPFESLSLAKIYKHVTVNLLCDGDLQQASRALDVGNKFAPNDPTILAAQVRMHLQVNRIDQVAPLLAVLESKTQDVALLAWLKAEHFMALNQPDEAIEAYEQAIALEHNETHQETLHFNAAFAYGMAGKRKLSPRQQGDGIIRHLEDAIHLGDNPVYHALKGYGWALRGDLGQFEAEFRKVTVVLESIDSPLREQLSALAEHWKTRGFSELGQWSKAAEIVRASIGSAGETRDVDKLLVLARESLDLGIEGDPEHLAAAERYVERVIELQPSHGEAYALRALVYALRAEEHASDPGERARLEDCARNDFLKSIRLGHEKPEMHKQLARLYERGGDPVNAAKHRQRWLELSPSDPEAVAHQALTLFDQQRDLAGAKAHLDAIPSSSAKIGEVYQKLAVRAVSGSEVDKAVLQVAKECLFKAIEMGERSFFTYNLLAALLSEMSELAPAIKYQRQAVALRPDDSNALQSLGQFLVRNGEFADARDAFKRALGLAPNDVNVRLRQSAAWSEAGQLDDAVETYADWLRLEPESVTANSNLAFVLFDLCQHARALEHWQRALCASPDDADSLAGQAAALHLLGRHDEGRASYLAAVSANADFLDEAAMRTKYLWSDAAIAAVRDDITAAAQDQGTPRCSSTPPPITK